MVSEAVARAASDLSAGRIADVRAAVNAVIEAIVSERYPAMETRQRQRFTASLQRLLADDPGIGAQLAALIEAKRDTPQ